MNNSSLTFLGTGSAFTLENYHNNALIEVKGKKYLLDCGTTIPYALKDLGVMVDDIDGIIISHIHADHTGGLEYLGFYGRFVSKKKMDLFIAEELVDVLWENTLKGGMVDSTNEKCTLETYFNVKPFKDLELFKINGLEIMPIKTVHVKNDHLPLQKSSYSFLLGKETFYSGDMLFNESILKELNESGIKRFFHDCQFFHVENGVHASLKELKTLPKEIKEKIIVMHYGDDINYYENEILSEGMLIARKFETYEI